MRIELNDIEKSLVTQSLMDIIVNSTNFASFEKDILQDVYDKIKELDKN